MKTLELLQTIQLLTNLWIQKLIQINFGIKDKTRIGTLKKEK